MKEQESRHLQILADKDQEASAQAQSFEDKISQLSKQAELEVRELKSHHATELSSIEKEHQLALDNLKQEKERDIKAQQIGHRAELHDLTETYKDSLAKKDQAYSDLQKSLEAEIQAQEQSYGAELKSMSEGHEERLSKLRSEFADSKEKLIERYESELVEHSGRYSKLDLEASNKLHDLTETLGQTQAEVSSLKVSKSSLEEKLEFKLETLDQLKEDYQTLEAEKKSYEELIETAAEGYSTPEVLRLKQELDQTLNDLSQTSFQLESNRESLSSWINKTKKLNDELKEKLSRILDLESQVKQQARELKRLSLTGESAQEELVLYSEKSPFEVLRIGEDAKFEEVREAYKSLMKQYNPHIVENMADEIKNLATEACKEINQAYGELKKRFVAAK